MDAGGDAAAGVGHLTACRALGLGQSVGHRDEVALLVLEDWLVGAGGVVGDGAGDGGPVPRLARRAKLGRDGVLSGRVTGLDHGIACEVQRQGVSVEGVKALCSLREDLIDCRTY